MSSPVPQVVVRGEATVSVEPDLADFVVTVRTTGADRQAALERCRARQAQVGQVLDEAGDAVEQAETSAVWVAEQPRRGARPEPVASLTTRVTVVRLDAVGDLVTTIGRLDDVDVWGPTWRLRPGNPAEQQARLAAIDDGVERARQYADALGARLTALVEVRDGGITDGGLRLASAGMSMARFDSAEPTLDLTPARQEAHGTVELRFAMSVPALEVFDR